MNTKVIAFAALIGALAFAIYEAISMVSDRSYSSVRMLKNLDDQVARLLNRYERGKQLGIKVRHLLGGSTIGTFIRFGTFFLVSAALGVGLALVGLILLHNPYAAVVLGITGLALPYQLLEIDYVRTQRRMRRQGVSFLLAVSNVYAVYGDPLIALEQTAPQLSNPLRKQVRWFVTAVRSGEPLSECVEAMKAQTLDPTLQNFWNEVGFYISRGGPFDEAIVELLGELYDREAAEAEKKVATGSTLATFAALLGVYFVLLTSLTKTNPFIVNFMLYHQTGRLVVALMIAIIVGTLYIVKRATIQEVK